MISQMRGNMSIARRLRIALAVWISFLPVQLVHADSRPEKLPAGYRYIGVYKMNSKVKVERGQAMPVVISPLVYRVYSDGIDVRVYCRTDGEDSYTSYSIYRSDGIGVARSSGELDLIAGVQAMSQRGDMVRQVSVTRASLTMVKMPPRSHRVIITRAVAIKEPPAKTNSSPNR